MARGALRSGMTFFSVVRLMDSVARGALHSGMTFFQWRGQLVQCQFLVVWSIGAVAYLFFSGALNWLSGAGCTAGRIDALLAPANLTSLPYTTARTFSRLSPPTHVEGNRTEYQNDRLRILHIMDPT